VARFNVVGADDEDDSDEAVDKVDEVDAAPASEAEDDDEIAGDWSNDDNGCRGDGPLSIPAG
jgi:hypothetical protein